MAKLNCKHLYSSQKSF